MRRRGTRCNRCNGLCSCVFRKLLHGQVKALQRGEQLVPFSITVQQPFHDKQIVHNIYVYSACLAIRVIRTEALDRSAGKFATIFV